MAIYKLVTDYLLNCLQGAVKKIQCSLGKPGGIATLDDTGNVPVDQLANAGGGGAGVASFNGRSGVVSPANNDYSFSQISSKPTTIAGYGITDAVTSGGSTTQYIRGDGSKVTFPTTVSSFSNDSGYLTSSSNVAWNKVTSTPTTISGYGITDAIAQDQFLGNLYNKSSWTDLSDFTNNGATVSVISNALRFTGGANTYTQVLQVNKATCLEYWKMTAQISVDEITTTSFGFGLGIFSINTTGKCHAVGRIQHTTTNNQMFIDGANNATWSNEAVGSVAAVTAGDTVEITVERVQNTIYLTSRNVTTNSGPTTISYSYNFLTSANSIPNTGNFSIYSFGGQFTVKSLVIFSNELKNAGLMVVGDSKSVGYYASALSNRFASLLTSDFKVAVHSGGNDKTTEVLAAISEIISLAPQQVLLCIGSNDQRVGFSSTTFQNNYNSISSQLLTAGIKVYYALPFFETAQDLTGQKTFIQSTFASNLIIDTFTPTSAAGSLNVDGIHPNDQGHLEIYNAIIASGLLGRRTKVFTQPVNIGTGTANTIPLFASSNTLANSSIAEGTTFITSTKQFQFNTGFSFFNSSGATDEKIWNFFTTSNNITFSTVNDARNTNANWLVVTRTGNSPTLATFTPPVKISNASGTSLTLPVTVSGFGIDYTGNITGSFTPFRCNSSATAGMSMQLINASATSGAYSCYYAAANGTTGANATASFYNNSANRYWNIGQQSSTGNFMIGTGSAFFTDFTGTNPVQITPGGNVGIRSISSATAYLHIAAGTATAGTAPLKLNSGVNLTTTEAGAIEYDGSHLYFTATNAGTRFQLDQQTGGLIKYQHTIFTPATGGTVTLVNGQYNIINPAGALATLTVNLPSTPANNDAVHIKYTQAITSVTYGNGTVVDGITAPTAGGLTILVYDSGTTSWY
jgi:lysophospholipase L1-like esterase